MFIWDPQKAITNFEKHEVSFEEAATAFADEDGLDWEDTNHSKSELRRKRLAQSVKGRIILTVYTIRYQKMAKKKSGSSVRGKRTAKSAKHIPDSEIDYSDIPESTDQELKKARRVGRPKSASTKQLIAIRLDPKLISRLKKLAKSEDIPYQTLIHQLLEEAVDDVA